MIRELEGSTVGITKIIGSKEVRSEAWVLLQTFSDSKTPRSKIPEAMESEMVSQVLEASRDEGE